MAFSDSNRVGIRFVPEVTWGVTVSSAAMQALNITSESFKSNVNTVTSDTIRADRNVSDITQVGGGAGGDVGFELRYNDIDELIAGALQNAWVTTEVSAAVASASFTASAIVVADSAEYVASLKVGNLFRVSGATTSANNGDYYVSAITTTGASSVTLLVSDASSGASVAFTPEVFAAGTAMKGRTIRNGVTPKSYTIEKVFSDVSTTAVYAGMRVTAMSLNFESQSILTGSLGFVGKNQVTGSTTIASTITDASINEVMNASGNVGRVWEGGQAVTGVAFQSISVDLNNNPREQAKIGSDALAGVGTGRAEVTGNVTAYFENNDLIDKFTTGTKTNFRFQVTDADGNSYIVDIPKVTYTDFTIAAGGGNQDVVQDGSWGASIDATGAYSIQITALDA